MHIASRKKVHGPLLVLLVLVVAIGGFLYWSDLQLTQHLKANALADSRLAAPKGAATVLVTPTATEKANEPFAIIASDTESDIPPIPPELLNPQATDAQAPSMAAKIPQDVPAPQGDDAQPFAQGADVLTRSAPATVSSADAASSAAGSREAGLADSSSNELQPPSTPLRAALSNVYFVYLAGVTVVILLFLNMYHVEFTPQPALTSDVYKTLSSQTRLEMMHALHVRRKTLS